MVPPSGFGHLWRADGEECSVRPQAGILLLDIWRIPPTRGVYPRVIPGDARAVSLRVPPSVSPADTRRCMAGVAGTDALPVSPADASRASARTTGAASPALSEGYTGRESGAGTLGVSRGVVESAVGRPMSCPDQGRLMSPATRKAGAFLLPIGSNSTGRGRFGQPLALPRRPEELVTFQPTVT